MQNWMRIWRNVSRAISRMAGIKFWADMKGLDESFLQKAAGFKQIVPVFTNVIFDTSQPHANTVFGDMFDWLEMVLEIIRAASGNTVRDSRPSG